MIDINEQIKAVRRQVGARVVAGGEARTVMLSQTYDADIDEVWSACTDPERLPRWFLPVSGELRLGGRYQFEGNAGGTIEKCEPPTSLAATWEFDGDVSRVEVRLSPDPEGGTRFELEHVLNENDHWREFGPGAVGIGWELGLSGLATYLTGQPVDPEGAWTATGLGVQFMTLSNQLWCEAYIAAGANPADAEASAARTIAAYTATPAE